ncbi:MAG: DUF4248 domain-containing protein [Bacteroides sp.]|nr:DUF4248 domain-containing protein [Bacteroides sp.]
MKVKPMTVKELAGAYNVHPSTIRRWFRKHRDEIGPRRDGSRFYSVRQVKIIFSIFDVPFDFEA